MPKMAHGIYNIGECLGPQRFDHWARTLTGCTN